MAPRKKKEPATGNTAWVSTLSWWSTLAVTVLAVPLLGALVALSLSMDPVVQVVAFVMTCWLCTWLGMWVMRKANKK